MKIWLPITVVILLAGCDGGSRSGTGNALFKLDSEKGVTCHSPDWETLDNTGTYRSHECRWYCGYYKGKYRYVWIKWKATDSNGYRWIKANDNIWSKPYNSSYCD